MKTIEQILEERYPIQEQESYDNYLFRLQRGGFNHGIEVAEEWIKVSDELPSEENGYINEEVLCKVSYGSISPKIEHKIWRYNRLRFTGETDWVTVISWRPLHRK